jgi:hypothetical protein
MIAWALYLLGVLTVVAVSWDDDVGPRLGERERRLTPIVALAWPLGALAILIWLCCIKGKRRG